MKLRMVYKGGDGSGHFGHAGRPGKHGGSLPGEGGGNSPSNAAGSGVPKIASAYFDTKGRSGSTSWSTYEEYSKSGKYIRQSLVVHKYNDGSGYFARVSGGSVRGSSNTYGESKKHSTAEDAINEAIKKATKPGYHVNLLVSNDDWDTRDVKPTVRDIPQD